MKLDEDGFVKVRHKSMFRKGKNLKELAFSVRKGIDEEAKDIYLFDLFERISKTPEWVLPKKSKGKVGYTQIDNNAEKFGPLAGLWVKTPIAKDITEYSKIEAPALRIYKRMFSKWKAGKTVWSPSTQVRNLISNWILADFIGDVGLSNAPAYVRGFRAAWNIHRKADNELDQYETEIKHSTKIQTSTFTTQELGSLGSIMDDLNITAGKEGTIGSMLDAYGKLQKILKKPGQAYQFTEEFMKAAVYIHHRRKGSTVFEAEKRAQEALFDYSDVPTAVAWARQGYSPFATFIYKATPALIKSTARKPWKLVKYYGLMYGAQWAFKYLMGWDEEEMAQDERVLPEYMRDGLLFGTMPSHIRLPYTDEAGNTKWLDVSYMLPWGTLTETHPNIPYIPTALLPNHPLINWMYGAMANEEMYIDKPLYMKHETDGERMLKIMWYGAEQAAPGVVNPDKIMKVVRGIRGDVDYRGEDYSTWEAIADYALGLKIRNHHWLHDATFRTMDIDKKMQDAKIEFSRKIKDIFWNRQESLTPEEKTEKFRDATIEFNEDVDRLSDEQFKLYGIELEKGK
jgi:hypothetical protein